MRMLLFSITGLHDNIRRKKERSAFEDAIESEQEELRRKSQASVEAVDTDGYYALSIALWKHRPRTGPIASIIWGLWQMPDRDFDAMRKYFGMGTRQEWLLNGGELTKPDRPKDFEKYESVARDAIKQLRIASGVLRQ